MKRFIIWLCVVVSTILLVDILLGLSFNNYTKNNRLPGDYESIEKVLRYNDADILLLGSSVALNSINAKAMEDSLGCKTFNGGGNGQVFPFYLTLLKAAVAQKVPQKIVLCLLPDALYSTGLGSRYNLLAPYYGLGISDIDDNMSKNGMYDKYLLNLTSYKLNKIWFRILLYNFISPNIKGENGYIGKPVPVSFPEKSPLSIQEFSEERRDELRQFMQICADNNIDLTLIFTPVYRDINLADADRNVITETAEMAGRYNVKLYNDLELEPFASDSTLFYDDIHINVLGSELYTDTIISRLRNIEK